MNALELSHWNDKYYRLDVVHKKVLQGSWQVHVRVLRNDSDEDIGGVVAKGVDQVEALGRVEQLLPEYMQTIERPPYEWQKVELRMILVDYKKFRYELTRILIGLNSGLVAGILSEEELHSKFWNAVDKISKGSAALALRIAALSETERAGLMVSSENTYKNSDDPWSMEDMDARSELFDLIVNPSAAVASAHHLHKQNRIKGIGTMGGKDQ